MEAISIAASTISVILAIVAISQAMYFFTQAKKAELNSATALESIRVQSEALQKLAGRWMDRLTRYATEPRVADEALLVLAGLIREIPLNIASQLQVTYSQLHDTDVGTRGCGRVHRHLLLRGCVQRCRPRLLTSPRRARRR